MEKSGRKERREDESLNLALPNNGGFRQGDNIGKMNDSLS